MAIDINNLRDLFILELRDILDAEEQLIDALPKMAEKANNAQLRDAFTQHLEQTRNQRERLEQVFRRLGIEARTHTCKAMEGLLREGKEVLKSDAEGAVMDAALIAIGNKVEHYEIAAYGTLCVYAEQLGLPEVKNLLGQTLEEEKAADAKLTALAEQTVNQRAQRAS